MKKFLSVLLAVMMVLSTVSFAAPFAMGTLVTVENEIPAVNEESAKEADTAVLAADLSEDVDSYGELIFELNFDNLATQTQTGEVGFMFTDAGYIDAEAEQYSYLSDKGRIFTKQYESVSIKERAAGNNYYEVSGGTTGYAVVLIESGTDRGFQTQDGVYTLTADVYRPDNFPLTTRFTGSKSEDTPKQDFSGLVDGGWGKIVLQHDPSCFGNGGHETPMTSAKDVKTIKFHRNGGTTQIAGYDNIRLYYKPLTVDVTLKFEGKSVTKAVSTVEPVLVADLTKYLDLGIMYSATGAKIGDKTYTPDDYISFGKDTTVEITADKLDSKYVSDTYGLMIFDIDFETHEIGTDIPYSKSDFRVGEYATPIGKKVMSHDPSNWHLSDDGFDLKVMADPENPNNKVAGIKGATSGGYPVLMLTTHSNGAAARYGFIEDDDLIWTVVYDYYDTTADGIAIRFGGKTSRDDVEHNGQIHPQWTTFEDGPVESNTGKAASTWYSNIGVMTAEKYDRMGGSDELSFIKMHAASPENADIYYDNIRLYYKPAHVDVSFNANGVKNVTIANETLENVTSAGIKVSDLLAQAGVDYSAVSKFAHVFKGVSLDAEGTKVYGLNDTISFYENCTVYLIFDEVDMTGWQDENGILLYEIDFDDIANGTVIANQTLISSFGRVNPYVEGSENWYLNISQFSDGTVVDGALKFTKTAGGQWAQVQISNEKSNPAILISDGTIIKFADMKVVSDIAGITLGLTGYARKYNSSTGKWEGTTNNQNSVKTITADKHVIGNWHSLTGSKVLEGTEYNSESCTIYLPTYPAAGGIGDEFYLDNLKLYWKPANVNVTVYGGSNAGYETVDLANVSTTSTVEDVIARLPGSAYGKITGLADMKGNKLTSLNLITDASFVAIWTPWVELAGAQEFPEDKKGISTSMWSGGYAYAGDVGNGGADTTTAVHNMYGKSFWSENGNMYRTIWTPQIGDDDIGEGDTADTVQTFAIPAGRTHFNEKLGDMDCIRENIKVNLAAANDAEYILVKYRYTDLPNLAELVANCQNPTGYEYSLSADGYTIYYTDRWGDAASATLKPSYGAKYYVEMQNGGYEYAGGLEFHQNELMVEGEWLYDMIPVTEKIATNGAKTLIVQQENIFHDQKVEFDYIRFVKMSGEEEDVVLPDLGGDDDEPEGPVAEAPVTNEAETALRMNDEDMANNGIRFMASATKVTKAAAANMGWIIASYDYFMANYSSYDALTIEAVTGKNIKAGYNMQDGTVKGGFGPTTDENALPFSVVLRGIPEDNYMSYIIVRPFVEVEGEYMYGEAFSTCMYDLALAIFENDDAFYALTEDQQTYIEDIVYYCEDNLM